MACYFRASGFTISFPSTAGVPGSGSSYVPETSGNSSNTVPSASRQTAGEQPAAKTHKGQRPIYWNGSWHEAAVYEMDLLEPGNIVHGPAVIEAPATTLLLPPGFVANLGPYRIFEITQPS